MVDEVGELDEEVSTLGGGEVTPRRGFECFAGCGDSGVDVFGCGGVDGGYFGFIPGKKSIKREGKRRNRLNLRRVYASDFLPFLWLHEFIVDKDANWLFVFHSVWGGKFDFKIGHVYI